MLKKIVIGFAMLAMLTGSLLAYPRMVLIEEFTGQS